LKTSTKLAMTAFFGVMMIAAMAGASKATATSTNVAFAVGKDQSWTWKVTTCAWDNSSHPMFVGKGATITITDATNTTSYSWIKGNVSLFNADGSTLQSLSNVLLGNVSISNVSKLSVYSSGSNFVLPVIIPIPLSQTFAAFGAFVNTTLHGLIAQYGAQIPFTIANNFVINATASTFSVIFYVSGSISGYTFTNQPVEVAFSFDSSGVVTKIIATAKNINMGSSSITVDLTLFEIDRTDMLPSSTPGYSVIIIGVGAATAVSIVVARVKRRN